MGLLRNSESTTGTRLDPFRQYRIHINNTGKSDNSFGNPLNCHIGCNVAYHGPTPASFGHRFYRRETLYIP